MVLDLLLIALAITLDPLPLTAFVLVVASAKGVWKGLVFILSWLACLVAVIAMVLALTGGHPPAPRSTPSTAVLAAKLAIGVGLVVYGVYRRRRMVAERSHHRAPEPPSLTSELDRSTVWTSAGLAVLLQPWGMVAAGATTVVSADLSHPVTWLVLFSFCLLATASLLAVELYVVLAPEQAKPRLLKLRAWMKEHQQQAIVILCLGLGLWLTGKSIYQLTA
ncbi:GAP family protein [Streptomyces sp. NPDC048045]|uniref:GAP family protein n=1 Tax=Streptomyces sp. NPDC048045 TaxID=3154710 RepID=UPI0034393B78